MCLLWRLVLGLLVTSAVFKTITPTFNLVCENTSNIFTLKSFSDCSENINKEYIICVIHTQCWAVMHNRSEKFQLYITLSYFEQ